MIGPCMCGDPYCPSCGDPGLAKYEQACDDLLAELEAAELTPEEFEVFKTVGLAAVDAHRAGVKAVVSEVQAEHAMYVEHLKSQIGGNS